MASKMFKSSIPMGIAGKIQFSCFMMYFGYTIYYAPKIREKIVKSLMKSQ